MTANGLRQPLFSAENKPLLWALLISVVVHAVAFWVLFVLAFFTLFLSSAKQEALAQMLHTEKARARTTEEPEPQLTFVQVDPTQAPAEAPKNAKYYAAQNSQAANPDADKDTGAPKIDGKQTEVLKTETAMPLQPSRPQPHAEPDKSEPAKSDSSPKIGDLAMAKPVAKPDEAPQISHERPHTLAEARMLAGEKMKEDGGVNNHHVSTSFDAVGSPFGEYDERIIEAISERWYTLLESPNLIQDRAGSVVVSFRLFPDGRIANMRVVHSDMGEILTDVCVSAIRDPSPYDHWPEAMYRKNKIDTGNDFRDIRFTFYYEE